MDERSAPCKALVLAGGGARGSYQVGVWRALMELDWHPQIITGTSVGSLNGAMFVLDQYETARDMWLAIRSKDVMELPEEDADLSALHQFLRSVVKAGGMDVTPLEEIVERVLDEDALRAAPIRFGLVTVEQRGLKPRELTLDEIPAGKVKDYLMASAACFPALRAREIDGVKFLDGGYSDNMPTGLAKRMGADELVCVDLEGVGITRPNLTGLLDYPILANAGCFALQDTGDATALKSAESAVLWLYSSGDGEKALTNTLGVITPWNTASDTTTLGAMQVEQVNTAILPGIDLPTAAAAQALTANEEALQGGTRGKAERTAFTQAALAALGAE